MGIYYALKPKSPEPSGKVSYETFLQAVTRLYKPDVIKEKYVGHYQLAKSNESKDFKHKISSIYVDESGFSYFVYDDLEDVPAFDVILNPAMVQMCEQAIGTMLKDASYYISGDKYSVWRTLDNDIVEKYTVNNEMVITHYDYEKTTGGVVSYDITYVLE